MYKLSVLLLLMLVGCSSIIIEKQVPFSVTTPSLNQTVKVTVGEAMISSTSGIRWVFGDGRTEDHSNFECRLIYNGAQGNVIRVGYREFSQTAYGMVARPAFSNDVTYDLTVSKSIRYKGAKIDVLDADNEQIVFRLTEDFSDK